MLYIYSGPSLNPLKIKEHFGDGAKIMPPVKGGDILTLLSNELVEKPSRIHIIDGYYYNVPSVRHKEIMQAIDQGIIVSGCSSMGAIRAAECKNYGMIGFGRIYDYYASNFVSGDDEVAVSHEAGPTYTQSSTPLINIRFTLDDMHSDGILDAKTHAEIIEYFKKINFAERNLKLLLREPQFEKYYSLICQHYKDWKCIDALESLQILESTTSLSSITRKGFYSGYNHVNYYNDTEFTNKKLHIEKSSLPKLLSNTDNFPKTLYDAYNRSLVVKFAKHLGIKNNQKDFEAFVEFVEKLKEREIMYEFLPLGYENYKHEIIEQELLILKLQLWLVDTAGLSGNLGILTDYMSSHHNLNSQSNENAKDKLIEYEALLRQLLDKISESSAELSRKFMGLSTEDLEILKTEKN